MVGEPEPLGGMFSVLLLLSPLCPHTPLKLPRLDVTYQVRFYGNADRVTDGSGRAVWQGGQEVLAVAYDVMIPGYGTKTTNNLRLWESKPKRGFDLNSFNGEDAHLLCFPDVFLILFSAGNYEGAVEASNSADAITSVLYPNDHTYVFLSDNLIRYSPPLLLDSSCTCNALR